MLDVTAVIPTVGRFFEVKQLCLRLKEYGIRSVVVVDGPYKRDDALLEIESISIVKYLVNNVGQALATDEGIKLVDTDKIMLIDSDDFLSVEDLTILSEAINNMRSKDILLPRSVAIGGGRVVNRENCFFNPMKSLRKNFIGAQSGVIFIKNDYLDLGGQSKVLVSCKDWDIWIKASINGFTFAVYNADIFYAKSFDGISRNLDKVLEGRFQLWRSHPWLFTPLGRPYDWYLLLRYVAFNCPPKIDRNVSFVYSIFYPVHYLVYKYVKRFLGS